MKNSVLEVDPERYGLLLARKLPGVIRTEEENERLIAELEEFDRRYEELTPEEREYSELLTVLIEAFEDAHYAIKGSTPASRLCSLMEEHGLRQRDFLSTRAKRTRSRWGGRKISSLVGRRDRPLRLFAVFGSRGIASEGVRGKPAISKAQAKKLAEVFHVPVDLFLCVSGVSGDFGRPKALLEQWLALVGTRGTG